MTFPYDQARLQQLFDDVDTRTAAAVQVAQQAAQFQPRSKGLTEADLAEIERFARGGKAPKELRDLQGRVDAGEFSWQDVAAGRVLGDEGVLARRLPARLHGDPGGPGHRRHHRVGEPGSSAATRR